MEQKIAYVNYGLIIANVLVFAACIFFGEYLYLNWTLDPVLIINEHRWYQFLTSMFMHADEQHLAGNLIFLYAAGEMVEKEIGHVKYFILYISSGIIGSIASLSLSVFTMDFTSSLGASGAVFGVTGALLWIAIRNREWQQMITVPKMIFLIVISLYNGFIGTNIDNAAHIGGLIGGFVFAILLYRRKTQDQM